MSLDEGTPNLFVIDEAFGPSADLYLDVLGVQPNASNGQIQHSYFDRREELFRLLNDIDEDQEQDSIATSHRFHAERKLDAVVVAMRILGDPELRVEYDDMRFERLQGAAPAGVGRKSRALHVSKKTTPRHSQESRAEEDFPGAAALEDTTPRQRNSPPRTRLRAGALGRHNKENKDAEDGDAGRVNVSMDSTPSDEGGRRMEDGATPRHKVKSKVNSKSQVVSPDQGETPPRQKSRLAQIAKERKEEITREKNWQAKKAQERQAQIAKEALNTSIDETVETGYTFDEDKTTMTFASQGTMVTHGTEAKFANQIANEINGTYEDTQNAFEQVFSVFTLRDEDIMAVTGKIDKAKRQIERNLTSPANRNPAHR
jgi:curved DNA-binding protein CbpA